MKVAAKLWIGLAILIALSPLGIILPEHFKAGGAWGEWGLDEIKVLTGYIPKGLEKLASIWEAPIPDYAFKGWEKRGPGGLSIAYIFSAIIGIALTVFLVTLIGRILMRRDK